MTNNMPEVKKLTKEKLIVKPIMWSMYHIHAYQGPCRYGQGYSLTEAYDRETTQIEFGKFKQSIADNLNNENIIIKEPQILFWNEDFVIRDSVWEVALADDQEVDVYLICGIRITSYFAVSLAKKTTKPIVYVPSIGSRVKCSQNDISAHLIAIGREEFYPCFDMSDVIKAMDVIRVKKIMNNMRLFFPLKSAILSFGCQSSYITLNGVSEIFGTEFVHVNAQEVLEEIDNLTEDEVVECSKLANELVDNAKNIYMPKERVINDVKFYWIVKKMMSDRSCNAFTIPCFEVCATRELNRRQTTFCLAKSLLREEGIPSACAGDVGAVIANALLMAITNSAPYMGNTMIQDRENNICRIQHDSPTRFMKGYDNGMMPYELVNFAKDGWGTTIRYDFSKDIGELITAINLSPDMKRIMIVKGEISGCLDYLTPECTLSLLFKISDAERFIECQKYVGHHFCMVYGDWVSKIALVAKAYNMEVMIVE